MSRQLMVDLETMDTTPRAIVLSIGAVIFDEVGVHERYYANLEINTQLIRGRNLSERTLMWWLQQDQDARDKISTGLKQDTSFTLSEFATWVKQNAPEGIWGNGAAFDNVVLESMYDEYDLERPWAYYQNRCYRTLKAVAEPLLVAAKLDWEKPAVAHDALYDAIAQANNARTAMNLVYRAQQLNLNLGE